MNAESAMPRQGVDPIWDRVIHDVNAWRGACLHQFTAAEAAVTETLLSLRVVPEKGPAVRLRHLTGQRFDDLAILVDAAGAFGGEGAGALKALEAFRAYEALRTYLAHGVVKITVERTGKWVVLVSQVSIRAKQSERTMLVLEESRALEQLADLKRKSGKLCSELGNLRRDLSCSSPCDPKGALQIANVPSHSFAA